MTTLKTLYVVTIVEDSTGDVVKESKPTDYRQACKLENGYYINLDHARYSIYVEPEEK